MDREWGLQSEPSGTPLKNFQSFLIPFEDYCPSRPTFKYNIALALFKVGCLSTKSILNALHL